MNEFKLQAYSDFLSINEAKKFDIPKVGKLDLRKIKAEIEGNVKFIKGLKGLNQGFFFSTPLKAKGLYFDELVYCVYKNTKTDKWREMRFVWQGSGKKRKLEIITNTITDKRALNMQGKADIKPTDIKKATFTKMYKSWEAFITSIDSVKDVADKVKKKKVQSDIPNESDTEAVGKWLNSYFEKNKTVQIKASKNFDNTIIIFWRFEFKPSIAKFKNEIYHDMYVNLDTKEIAKWSDGPIPGVSYGTMETLKKLPKDLKTIMKWEKEKEINNFNNGPANKWHR